MKAFRVFAVLLCLGAVAHADPPLSNQRLRLRYNGVDYTPSILGLSSFSCAYTAATGLLSCSPSVSLGNSSFSGNDWTTSGSPTTIRTVHQFADASYTFSDLAITKLGTGDYKLQPSGGGYIRINSDITIANPSESAFVKVQASGSMLVSGAISGDSMTLAAAGALRLSDESAKGTCDSSIPGKVKYEVAASVGTLYVCRQTGAGTYAWAALH